MLNKQRFLFFFLCLNLFISHQCFAWCQEISVGYGAGREIEQDYTNRGIVFSGKVYRLPNIDDTLVPTIDVTLANINATYRDHKHITIGALALAMRAYFADPTMHPIRPYLQASFGPAVLSTRTLGNRTQGAHFAFQTTLEMGTEFCVHQANFDINLRIAHYCNAGIFHPNQGINLSPILSIGYLF